MKTIVIVILFAVGFAACAPVPAWKRGQLLQRSMEPAAALDRRFAAHIQQTRESALGANQADGASCGCN